MIGGLKAGWSFKDSWVANLTIATSAFTALISSSDVLTLLLGNKPTDTLGMMTLIALASAALIGLANTLVKVIGPTVEEVTVVGLGLSTALVVFAAGLQVVATGEAAAAVLGSEPLIILTRLLECAVCTVLIVYAVRMLRGAILDGVKSSVPAVPEDALISWAGTSDWEKLVAEQRLRRSFAQWLEPSPGATDEPGSPRQFPLLPDDRRASLV